MNDWQTSSKILRYAAALFILALLIGILACTLPGGSNRNNSSAVPITPKITLPPQWTDTPLAEPTGILGWAEYTGNGVSLWLPDRYVGGNPSRELETVVQQLRLMGPEFESTAKDLEANPESFLLWVFDSEISATGFRPNVNVVLERVPPSITMTEYLAAAMQHVPEHYQVTRSEVTAIGPHEQVGVILIQTNVFGHELKEVGYIIKHGGSMFITTYACDANDFDVQLPIFQQSIATFKAEG